MGGSALLLLIFSHGSVAFLVTMYAINVFITFSISQFGMARFFYNNRGSNHAWRRHIPIHIIGFVLCSSILAITLFEKFGEGGWITILLTMALIIVCILLHRHYEKITNGLKRMDTKLEVVPAAGVYNSDPLNPKKKTAVQLVSGYHGFGLNTFYSILKNFPDIYENFIFVSVAVIDSGTFKGTAEIKALKESTRESLRKYVELARSMGFSAEYRMDVGTDVVEVAVPLCRKISKRYPYSTFFTGQIVFRYEQPFYKFLHNETAFAIQRRLQYSGITTVILPIQTEE
jgi:K+ transporter